MLTVPAKYAPFIEDAVRRAIREANLDADFRSDPSADIRRFAGVPDALLDHAATGVAVFAVTQEAP